jgi:hypothetical protein
MIPVYRCVCTCALAFLLGACGGGDDGGGATATLSWQPVSDPSVVSYTVHYGKRSTGSPGSCAYESSVTVQAPEATIGGLDFNTQYYFAVSAFNGFDSTCSNEASKMT